MNIHPRLQVGAAIGAAVLLVATGYAGPYVAGKFQGRIAWSADGNHNDPDDWAASPMALAIFAEAGLKDRLVHVDYNCILPLTNPEWEKTHAESVLGAARHYGYDTSRFFDCRKDLDGAIGDLARAVNESAADNPLYLIIAGPVEVPYRAIRQANPTKHPFVYCISHSGWNDGYGLNYRYSFTKRNVIERDIHWVQIRDQNPLLSFGQYGRPSVPEEFAPYFWMRDAKDTKVRFLWERMVTSMRPDPSDAGMAWFLATGDEACDPEKLKRLIHEHQMPPLGTARSRVRLEAENFRHLEGCAVESRNDRGASHRLSVRLAGGSEAAQLRTVLDEPFTSATARYQVEVRYFDDQDRHARFALVINGKARGDTWSSPGSGKGWSTRAIPDVTLKTGDEIRVDARGAGARVDFVELVRVPAP